MRVFSLAGMVAILCWATLSVQAYRLEFKDQAGATRLYSTRMSVKGTVEGSGMSIPMDSLVTFTAMEKVNGLKEGVAAMRYEVKEGSITMKLSGLPGEEEEQTLEQAFPTFAMTFNRGRSGDVSNLKFEGDVAKLMSNSQISPLNMQTGPGQGMQFPNRDLKVGDTWDGTQKFEMGPGNSIDAKVAYKLDGTEVVNGVTYLRIVSDTTATAPKMTMKVTEGNTPITMNMSMTIRGHSVTLFNEAEGQMFRSTYTGDAVCNITVGGADAISMKTSMKMDGVTERKQ